MQIFDFTGVYREQNFYRGRSCRWNNFTDLAGVNGFCDEEALAVLRERTGKTPEGIHFLDGGNFHYMSYVMTEKLKEPFCLAVVDHHTDMKSSLFDGLLSCGCWVKRVLDDFPFVRNVILIGVADELADSIEEQYRDRVSVYRESEVAAGGDWMKRALGEIRNPVYLSVDKDAFGTEAAVTDWDQGTMNLEQIRELYNRMKEKQRILGIDICGEIGGEPFRPGTALNSQTNAELIKIFGE